MAREGMNRDHQESEARCQQSSTAEGPVAYADLNVICAPPSEKNKSMNGKMMKTKNDFSSSSSSSSDEEKRVKNLGNPSVRAAANDDASLPSSSSSSLIFGSSQEFLRRSECLSSTSLDMSACSSHGITVPSFEASFCGKPSSDNMFGPMPQEPDVRADILCSEFSDTSGTTASNSGLSYDGESSSFDDIAHVPQAHDACIAPDSFSTVSQGHSITNPLCELKKSSSDNGFFLSQKPDVRSTIPPQKPGPARCLCCRKKLGLLGFKCRCGDLFCALHRYSDKHNCRFDYRTAAKEAIAKANPVVKAPKIWKL